MLSRYGPAPSPATEYRSCFGFEVVNTAQGRACAASNDPAVLSVKTRRRAMPVGWRTSTSELSHRVTLFHWREAALLEKQLRSLEILKRQTEASFRAEQRAVCLRFLTKLRGTRRRHGGGVSGSRQVETSSTLASASSGLQPRGRACASAPSKVGLTPTASSSVARLGSCARRTASPQAWTGPGSKLQRTHKHSRPRAPDHPFTAGSGISTAAVGSLPQPLREIPPLKRRSHAEGGNLLSRTDKRPAVHGRVHPGPCEDGGAAKYLSERVRLFIGQVSVLEIGRAHV